MELTVNTKALHKILSVLIKGVPNKPILPILDNFLIKVFDGKMFILSFDNELSLTAEIQPKEVKGTAEMAIPAKMMAHLVSAMPDGELKIIYTDGSNNVQLDWQSGNSVLPIFDAQDFPVPIMTSSVINQAFFSQVFLKSALTKTSSIINENEKRSAISGVYFDIRKDGSSIVGSDGGMLVCVDSPVVGDMKMIVPLKAANLIKSMLDKSGDVRIICDGKVAEFDFGIFSVKTLIIGAKYPDYRKVIPAQNPYVLCANRELIDAAIKRVMICADKASMMIRLKLSFNEVQLIGEDLGFQYTANETLACEYDGEDLEIGFKAPAIHALISNLESKDVEIKFKASNQATLIVPAGDQIKDETVNSVIMPMNLVK